MGAGNFAVYTAFKAKDGMTPAFKNMTRGANAFQERLGRLNYSAKGFRASVQGAAQKVNLLINAAVTFMAANAVKSTFQGFVDLASDLQETIGKTGEVFKENTDSVLNWAKTSIKSMGLAKQTALDTASLFGDMATGMDITTKRASQMSMRLTQLSADLSSFKNIEQEVAKNALKGVFTGETEALKNLGVVMTEAALQEYALSKGIEKRVSAMRQAEKVELRFQYVLEKTKNSHGDYLKTFFNFANQKRTFQEKLQERYTNFGEIILPKYTKALIKLNSIIDKHGDAAEVAFKSMFKGFESGFKAVKPVFDKFGGSLKYLQKHLFPELKKLSPVLKFFFKDVLIPGLVLAIDTLNKLFVVIDKTYNFIKKHWGEITTILIGVTGAFISIKKAQIAMTAQTIISTGLINLETVALKGMYFWEGLCALRTWNLTAAQSAFNTALGFSVSSLGYFVLAVGAAAAGAKVGMHLYNNWLPFRRLIDDIAHKIAKIKERLGFGIAGADINKSVFKNMSYDSIKNQWVPAKGHENEFNITKNGYYVPKESVAPRLVDKQLTPKVAGTSGVIEVRNIIENKNNSHISSSLNLSNAHNLTLNPLY